MGSLFSGVGLVSGLDINSIIDGLLRIEARPRDLLQTRIGKIDAQRTAFLEVSARVSALLGRISAVSTASAFRSTRAASSNASILNAATTEGAAPGAYQFVVRGLATTHQLVSSGVRDASAPLGAGTFTLESALARVNRTSRLDELNGYTGVQRGSFQIEDAGGATADIRLADAVTLEDVVSRINSAGLNVRAEVRNEALVLTERSGGVVRVRELDGGRSAADLGLSGSATGTLTGRSLARLQERSPLSGLNDGRGVRRAAAGGDFRITNSAGSQFGVDLSGLLVDSTRLERLNGGRGVDAGEIRITNRRGDVTTVDLSAARTIGDVQRAIESSGARVSVVLNAGRLIVTDTSGATTGALKIEDVSGNAARDLGIAGNPDSGRIDGRTILSVDTLGDVIRAVNFAAGNDGSVTATLDLNDPTRLTLRDASDGTTGRVLLERIGDSQALADLGLRAGDHDSDNAVVGGRIVGGVNTTLLGSLNGGRGIALGTLRVSGAGGAVEVDLRGTTTLDEALSRINAAAESIGVRASIASSGTRVQLANIDGSAAAISAEDVSGQFAAITGLSSSAVGGVVRGANLQRQYINENTALATLNAGRGVGAGRFRITDSAGAVATVDIPASAKTLGDVIRAINSNPTGARARINDTGDGLLLEDSAGGAGALRVEESGGATARDLNLLGPASGTRIDGSFELTITAGASDTLDSIVRRINERSSIAQATLLNDGSGINPFRLSIAARQSGAGGELIIDGGELGLDFSTLSRAADARVLVGAGADGGGVLVTSGTNTITNVVNGVTLTLSGVSTDPVTVTVDRNLDNVMTALKGFVTDYNDVVKRIKELSAFNQQTSQAGPLLGDSTIQIAQSRLARLVTGVIGGTGALTRLSQVGIRLGEAGAITFDEARFKQAYDANPEQVTSFFTTAETGAAAKLKKELEGITQDGGLFKRREKALDTQKTQLTERITSLNELLARRRQRLERQYRAMEQAISGLQAQQTALGSISSISAPTRR
ncbi:MAG: flagellar filament capping protein FliD [Phycisphaerales bacterium]|nr:flagellar filament capping protein FliD [Phycisphaerales bacterium]